MDSARGQSARAFILCASLVGLLALLASVRLAPNDIGIDDANIYFVYARNLVHGEGFVYNPGGERVEGFSSIAWVLVCALGFWLLDSPERLLVAVNTLVIAAALAAGAGYFRRRLGLPGGLFLGFCLLPVPFALWGTVSLLETGLWSALLLYSTLSLLEAFEDHTAAGRGPGAAPWLGPLLVLSRPEGLLWAPLFALLHGAPALAMGRGSGAALRRIAPALGSTLATMVAVTLFRLRYFGYPFPNTYYAKVSGDPLYSLAEGAAYLRTFVSTNAVLPPVVLALALLGADALGRFGRAAAGELRMRAARDLVLLLVIATTLAIPVGLGGDHFPLHRFYAPVWPLLALALGAAALRARSCLRFEIVDAAGARVLSRFAMLALALLLYAGSPEQWHRPVKIHREFMIARQGRDTGRSLGLVFSGPRPPSVGVIAAGGFALAWRGETVDLMGLNNLRMGHAPGNRHGWKNHAAFSREVFFELAPELVVPTLARCDAAGSLPGQQRGAHTYTEAALRGLLREEPFNRSYAPSTFAIPGRPGQCVFAWTRRDRMAALGAVAVADPPPPSGGWPQP